MERPLQITPEKVVSMVLTSSATSQWDLWYCSLYSCLRGRRTLKGQHLLNWVEYSKDISACKGFVIVLRIAKFQDHRSKVKVWGSLGSPNTKMAVLPLVFELERRSRAQNVALALARLFWTRVNFLALQVKRLCRHQYGRYLGFFSIFFKMHHSVNLTSDS